MRLGEKIFEMDQHGYRIDHIAKVLGIKNRSVSSLLSRERAARGLPKKRKNNFPATRSPKSKSPLISYAGADE